MCTVAQGLMEKGRSEQFKKDMLNNIKTLKELDVEDERIKELIMKNHGLTEEEAEEFLSEYLQ